MAVSGVYVVKMRKSCSRKLERFKDEVVRPKEVAALEVRRRRKFFSFYNSFALSGLIDVCLFCSSEKTFLINYIPKERLFRTRASNCKMFYNDLFTQKVERKHTV